MNGPAEVLGEEDFLLAALCPRIQLDLHFETRCAMTQNMDLFVDMLERTPRVVRSLTHGMVMLVAIVDEIIFSHGDSCNWLCFVTEGEYAYHWEEDVLAMTPRPYDRPRHPKSGSGRDLIVAGDVLSEAALWTEYEHQGELVSCLDSLLVTIDVETFSREITDHQKATTHVVRYAKHFSWRMDRAPAICDVIGFDLDLETIDEDLCIGGPEDHLSFISHYKLEAGTEATLLRDEIQSLIASDRSNVAGDFISPIFVDSEDLVDLTKLINHVQGSHCLILLLTPGFLTRPWCLLEIVTAKRHNRPFVPVQLVVPGNNFIFPDLEFYAKLHRDEIVSGGALGRNLLAENGVSLQDVEEAIKAVFTMIALPFSPHKSEAVRSAEMSEILKRCMQLTEDSLAALHAFTPLSQASRCPFDACNSEAALGA
jgi:hypothetical protein